MNNFIEVHEGKAYYCFFDTNLEEVRKFEKRNEIKFRFPTLEEAEFIMFLHSEIESVLLNEAMKHPSPFNIDARRKENIRSPYAILRGSINKEDYEISVAILMVVGQELSYQKPLGI